jgi:hypothetical protein
VLAASAGCSSQIAAQVALHLLLQIIFCLLTSFCSWCPPSQKSTPCPVLQVNKAKAAQSETTIKALSTKAAEDASTIESEAKLSKSEAKVIELNAEQQVSSSSSISLMPGCP